MSANPNLARASREERAAEATRLRDMGLNGIEVAERMGISTSYAYALLSDPLGEGERARKLRYRGTCVDCGQPADPAAERCRRCAEVKLHRERSERRVWTRERLVAAIREWASEHGEPPAIRDWSTMALHTLGDHGRYDRWRAGHAAGRWPEAKRVIDEFGTWNAAIAAAGFEPRAAHGGGGNQWRQRRRRKAAA